MTKNGRVCGTVTKLVGNHMPGPGRKRNPGTPLARIPIHVFKGKLKPFELFTDRPSLSLALTAYTDTDGSFEFTVPPGIYTVVAEINGKMYLNSYSSDGYWWYFAIGDGDVLQCNIVDSSEATF
jgi:hypothetical protein